MKKSITILLLVSASILNVSCTPDNPVSTTVETVEICPIAGPYLSETGKLVTFEPEGMFFDMSITEEGNSATYDNSYYLPFATDGDWQIVQNYTITPELITFSYYDIFTETTIMFTVTYIDCDAISISFTNGVEVYNRGTFIKIQ